MAGVWRGGGREAGLWGQHVLRLATPPPPKSLGAGSVASGRADPPPPRPKRRAQARGPAAHTHPHPLQRLQNGRDLVRVWGRQPIDLLLRRGQHPLRAGCEHAAHVPARVPVAPAADNGRAPVEQGHVVRQGGHHQGSLRGGGPAPPGLPRDGRRDAGQRRVAADLRAVDALRAALDERLLPFAHLREQSPGGNPPLSTIAGVPLYSPPPPRPNTGSGSGSGGKKVRKHGVAVFEQARATARHVNPCPKKQELVLNFGGIRGGSYFWG